MDVITRIIAKGYEETYGTTTMVENIAGAGGLLAANDLLGESASGCEMLTVGVNLFTLLPYFNSDVNVSLEDFKIIAALSSEKYMLYVNPEKCDITSWEDLTEYSQGQKLICGALTPGQIVHMLATGLFGEAGISFDSLSSDSSNKDLLALVSGDVDVVVCSEVAAKQFVEEGTAFPILAFTDDEYTGYEGITVPTAKSKGYDIVFEACPLLITRAEVDQAVVDELYQAFVTYQKTDEFKTLAENANWTSVQIDGAAATERIEKAAELCKYIYETYYAV